MISSRDFSSTVVPGDISVDSSFYLRNISVDSVHFILFYCFCTTCASVQHRELRELVRSVAFQFFIVFFFRYVAVRCPWRRSSAYPVWGHIYDKPRYEHYSQSSSLNFFSFLFNIANYCFFFCIT